jgi:hypothetical protein
MDQLSPEQRQAVLMQAQHEANQRIMQDVRGFLKLISFVFLLNLEDPLTRFSFQFYS